MERAGPRAVILLALAVVLAGLAACEPDETFDDGTPPPTASPSEAALATPSPTTAPSTEPAAFYGPFRRSAIVLSGQALASAERQCRAVPVPVYLEDLGSKRVVVADARGLGVIVLVFADDRGAVGCMVDAGADGTTTARFFRLQEDPTAALGDGELTLGGIGYMETPTGQRAAAAGRYGDRTVFVRAGFDDDTYVTASLLDGWYAMWWPSNQRPAVVVAGNNRNEAMGKITPP